MRSASDERMEWLTLSAAQFGRSAVALEKRQHDEVGIGASENPRAARGLRVRPAAGALVDIVDPRYQVRVVDERRVRLPELPSQHWSALVQLTIHTQRARQGRHLMHTDPRGEVPAPRLSSVDRGIGRQMHLAAWRKRDDFVMMRSCWERGGRPDGCAGAPRSQGKAI